MTMRVIIAAAVLLTITGCGRTSQTAGRTWLSPEIVEALKTPDSPDRIIYYPPVDLTKRPTPAKK
jgi:hypothetical protein